MNVFWGIPDSDAENVWRGISLSRRRVVSAALFPCDSCCSQEHGSSLEQSQSRGGLALTAFLQLPEHAGRGVRLARTSLAHHRVLPGYYVNSSEKLPKRVNPKV